ncbi:MAG: type I restriction endonuclease subunit R [Waddliaceae bacterium]
MNSFKFNEKYLSQLPALQTLIKLGYKYLSPSQAFELRKNKQGNVLLEDILTAQLRKLNSISYRGAEYAFTDENIRQAVETLRNTSYNGVIQANQEIYDLITLPQSATQTIEGNTRSFPLIYVDWKNWENNVFHCTAEFNVERSQSTKTARPDIVLFINGIPIAVIECKSPKEDVDQAVSQNIRNQGRDYLPHLFAYSQLLVATNKNKCKYATVGTPAKYWALWKEKADVEEEINTFLGRQLEEEEKSALYTEDFVYTRDFFEGLEKEENVLLTEQDRTLYSLCRPERLVDLVYRYTVFDGPDKKVARYHQFFVVKATLERVKNREVSGNRQGGIIWQTQGSGKSLTMAMLTRNLMIDQEVQNPRIILVTDREDLDKQLKNTFLACGLEPQRANTGRHLRSLIAEKRSGVITTLIHKFDKALNAKTLVDDSPDIFVLVDESHRTNFGSFAARMRQMLPNASYIGFTGTPLTKKDKNNFSRFGQLIEPHYSIKQAVEDEVVVPLLYEGRHVELTQDQRAIDLWFERHTQGLTDEQRADLKRKYARAEMLNKTERVIYERAFDISEHYRANWQDTGFKAQLVAPSKEAALRYHEYLEEFGYVTSDVIISPPDTREGHEEVNEESSSVVQRFWKKMMDRYGSEEEYNRVITERFKSSEPPEILIVVSKLLTGFDAPRNTVIYLCSKLREHTLLQAIARVNRLFEEKEYGAQEGTPKKDFGFIIDYASILGELDSAMSMYAEAGLEGFDPADLEGTLSTIKEEVDKLEQRHSDVWDVFKEIENRADEEAYERLLADEAIRDEFYERLKAYGKTLAIAVSSEKFVSEISPEKLQMYRQDIRKFENLKSAVRRRYAETIQFKEYEPKIRKLLDTHVQASGVTVLNEPVNIFDDETFKEVKEGCGVDGKKSTAARADMIAHATKKVIHEKLEEDPIFYEKFSLLIQKAIDDFRQQRISELEYLNTVSKYREEVVKKHRDNVPPKLKDNDEALAYYEMSKDILSRNESCWQVCEEASVYMAEATQDSLKKNWKVNFWNDIDAQNLVKNEIDDHLYDKVKEELGADLSEGQMDEVIESLMKIAKSRTNH